jgi:hypothetical protein
MRDNLTLRFMNNVLGSCLQLTLASDAGGQDGHDKDKVCVF